MDNRSAYSPIFSRDNKKPLYFRFCAFVKIAVGTIFTADNSAWPRQRTSRARKCRKAAIPPAEKLDVAFTTAQRAIEKLQRLGIVRRQGDVKRGRVYCAQALLDILEEPARLTH